MDRFSSELFAKFVRDSFRGLDAIFPVKTYSFSGQFVDTDKFDIVPKREYLNKEIARKEEELKQAEIRHRQYEERIREEISMLKDQRDKKRK